MLNAFVYFLIFETACVKGDNTIRPHTCAKKSDEEQEPADTPYEKEGVMTIVTKELGLTNGRTTIKLRVNQATNKVPDMKRYVLHIQVDSSEPPSDSPATSSSSATSSTSSSTLLEKNVFLQFLHQQQHTMKVRSRPFAVKKYIRPSLQKKPNASPSSFMADQSPRSETMNASVPPLQNSQEILQPPFSLPPPQTKKYRAQIREEKRIAKSREENSILEQAVLVYDLLDVMKKGKRKRAHDVGSASTPNSTSSTSTTTHNANSSNSSKDTGNSNNQDVSLVDQDGMNREAARMKVLSNEHDRTMRVVNGEVSVEMVRIQSDAVSKCSL